MIFITKNNVAVLVPRKQQQNNYLLKKVSVYGMFLCSDTLFILLIKKRVTV